MKSWILFPLCLALALACICPSFAKKPVKRTVKRKPVVSKKVKPVAKPAVKPVDTAYREKFDPLYNWDYDPDLEGMAVPAKYSAVKDCREGLVAVNIGMNENYRRPKWGKWGFADKTGKIVIPLTYKNVTSFSDGLAGVSLGDDKWGFIDKTGKLVIPRKYDYVEPFSEGLALVRGRHIETKQPIWGYINKNGAVIAAGYRQAKSFSNGLAAVMIDGRWGFIDRTGNTIIPPKYSYAQPFSEGMAAVSRSGRWGFIDTTGTVAIPFKYQQVGNFKEGLAMINLGYIKCGFIDKTGTIVVEPKYQMAGDFSEGMAPVFFGYNRRRPNVIIEEEIIEEEIDGVIVEEEIPIEVAEVDENYRGGPWGYIDKTGKIVIKASYYEASKFSEGFASVRDRYGRSYFIDREGHKATAQGFDEYQSCYPPSEGLAMISIYEGWGGKFGLIAKSKIHVSE